MLTMVRYHPLIAEELTANEGKFPLVFEALLLAINQHQPASQKGEFVVMASSQRYQGDFRIKVPAALLP